MFGVLLTIAYEGTTFSGFARQPNARTVAGELNGAIEAVDPKASLVRGASRTDAGVHAHGQPVAFDSTRELPTRGWVHRLQAELPDSIAIVRGAQVPVGFEPRKHARQKRYRYVLLQSEVRDPFWESRCWRVPKALDLQVLREAAGLLCGEHDFAAFRGAQDQRTETVRRIFRADARVHPSDPRCIEIIVEGDRFMYHMMRIITGTLVEIGEGRRDATSIREALATGDRRLLGVTAPAAGLYLDWVELDTPGTQIWPAVEAPLAVG